jgi:hypothetical protein
MVIPGTAGSAMKPTWSNIATWRRSFAIVCRT